MSAQTEVFEQMLTELREINESKPTPSEEDPSVPLSKFSWSAVTLVEGFLFGAGAVVAYRLIELI